jgi:hypothetical protein
MDYLIDESEELNIVLEDEGGSKGGNIGGSK